MTLRQFYLLLAEWYTKQRILDSRAYKFVMTQYTEAPDPGVLFPLLKDIPDQSCDEQADSDPDKDDVIFNIVTSSMSIPKS